MAIVTWTFDGITVIASCVAWWYAVQARRSARRIREIKNGGSR